MDQEISPALLDALSMMMDYGADPNPRLKGRPLDPWIGFLCKGLENYNLKLDGCVNEYIFVLDTMLSAANFDKSCNSVVLSTPVQWFRSGGGQDTCRTGYGDTSLRTLASAGTYLGKELPRNPRLLAEIIRIFVTRAAHPKLEAHRVIPDLERLIPPLARKPTLDAIARSTKVPGSRRLRSERKQGSIGAPAPRGHKTSPKTGPRASWSGSSAVQENRDTSSEPAKDVDNKEGNGRAMQNPGLPVNRKPPPSASPSPRGGRRSQGPGAPVEFPCYSSSTSSCRLGGVSGTSTS